jgi:hypothetical protein
VSKKTLFAVLAFIMLLTVVSQSLAFSPTLTFYEDYETGDTSKKDGSLTRGSGYTLTAGVTYKYNGTYGGYHYGTYSGASYFLPWGIVSYKLMNYSGKTELYNQQQYRINSFMSSFVNTQFMCFLLLGSYQATPQWQNGGTYDINGLILRAGIFKNSTGYYFMVDLPTIYVDRYFSSLFTFNTAQWYLFEVLINGQNLEVKSDGVSVLNATLDVAAFQITNVGMVYWGCYSGFYPTGGGSGVENIAVWNDNIYLADDLPDVYYPLAINALNVADSSNITVPMKINDVEYYTPIAASLEAGIYIIQPENIGFNSSYYWNFINWTDGADRVRTINFTGSASYTAYYRLTKIPDVGGYLNFFIGLFGLCLIGGSWFVLKWQWDEKEYAFALSAWLAMMMIGFALCMIMFGA